MWVSRECIENATVATMLKLNPKLEPTRSLAGIAPDGRHRGTVDTHILYSCNTHNEPSHSSTRVLFYYTSSPEYPPHAWLGAPWDRGVHGHRMRSKTRHSPSEGGLNLARPNPNLAPEIYNWGRTGTDTEDTVTRTNGHSTERTQ